jgi:uncharacterized protein (DUF1778 family)
MPRQKPVVLSTRASETQAAIIRAAATAEGRTVNEWALPRLLDAARERLGQELAGSVSSSGGDGGSGR